MPADLGTPGRTRRRSERRFEPPAARCTRPSGGDSRLIGGLPPSVACLCALSSMAGSSAGVTGRVAGGPWRVSGGSWTLGLPRNGHSRCPSVLPCCSPQHRQHRRTVSTAHNRWCTCPGPGSRGGVRGGLGGRLTGGNALSSPKAGRVPDWLLMLGLACLAVAVRLLSMNASGGLGAALGYDDGVYFAATNALLHGQLPYGDFVFLHPPGILLIGAGPVSASHWIGLDDAQTLTVVRAVFVGLGALNTVLVFLAGRHLSRMAGLSAALLYATWLPAVRPERSILLEPVVALGTLAALVLIPPVTARKTSGRWRPVVAGSLGGLAIATKFWAVVPILVVALGLLVVRRWRTTTAYLATALASLALCVAPFLALTGDRLWQMVVASQLERPPMGDSRLHRLALIMGLDGAPLTHLVSPNPPPDIHLRAGVRDAFLATDRAHLVVAGLAAAAAVVSVIVAIRLSCRADLGDPAGRPGRCPDDRADVLHRLSAIRGPRPDAGCRRWGAPVLDGARSARVGLRPGSRRGQEWHSWRARRSPRSQRASLRLGWGGFRSCDPDERRRSDVRGGRLPLRPRLWPIV